MAWEPTAQVFDFTQTVANLLEYISDNGSDAIDWASGDTSLPGFAKLYPNAPGRLIQEFPALVVLSQDFETDLTGDVLTAGLRLKFESFVSGPNLDDLVLTAKKYAMALESMLANIPSDTLGAGTFASLFEIGTALDVSGQFQQGNSWLAIFQTTCVYRVNTAAY